MLPPRGDDPAQLVPWNRRAVRRREPVALAGYRPLYRLLTYFLSRVYQIDGALYGDDRADEVDELYDSAFSWADSA
jgi:hypothetical protein